MERAPYLTARQVAELLQLNIETVYTLIAKGELPAMRVGGRWRFDGDELREWLRGRRGSNPAATEDGRA